METPMTSSKPYLLRAFYEWVLDNQCTPHLLVDAAYPGTLVPQEYVKDGRIVLNLAPGAIRGLQMDNERVEFSARFAGIARQLYVPTEAVLAIYARENGRGMFFEPESYESSQEHEDMLGKGEDVPSKPDDTPDGGGKKKPGLRLVK